jgi:hypothetical protein
MSVVAERPLGELEDELALLSAHLSAGMARWLEVLAEFDLRLGWKAWGGCSRWLAWRCGLDNRTARERVRVARALGGLPLIRAAFRRGELSYAKVRALTRVSAPANEEELLELAGELTASQLERALSAARRVDDSLASRVQDAERLSWTWAQDGSLVFSGRLASEDGALFLKALEVARERLWRAARDEEPAVVEASESGSAEPPAAVPGPSRVEALLAMADASLARDGERSGGDRYQVVVHVDVATLSSDAPGISVLEDGPPVAFETVRRLSCDSSLVALLEGADRPLGIGRKTRAVPPSLRRALRARDGCCRFPGCTNSRGLQAHHLEHWADGGPTELTNLILLCRHHHRLVHEDGWTVNHDGLFHDPFGLPVPTVPGTPKGRLDELRALNEQLDLGPHTGKHGRGEQIDLGYVSDALVRIIKRCRTKPRPRLVWTFTEYDAKRDRYGPARIDTPDQNGVIIATEHLANRINLFHANMLALERGLAVQVEESCSPNSGILR